MGQARGRFITNCDRYYKVRHGLLQIAMVPVHDLLLKFWNTFQTISNSSYRPLTSLTKTDMYIYFFSNPSWYTVSVVLKFCISSYLQKLFRKYSILPIVYTERGQTASVLWGTQVKAQGASKSFLSTCPSDMYYFKFDCPKPKGSCPKSLAQNSKTIGHIFYCLLLGCLCAQS